MKTAGFIPPGLDLMVGLVIRLHVLAPCFDPMLWCHVLTGGRIILSFHLRLVTGGFLTEQLAGGAIPPPAFFARGAKKFRQTCNGLLTLWLSVAIRAACTGQW